MATKKNAPANKKPATPIFDKFVELRHSVPDDYNGPMEEYLPDEYDVMEEYIRLPTKTELSAADKWITDCQKEYNAFLAANYYLIKYKKEMFVEVRALKKWENDHRHKCPTCGKEE